MDATFEPSDMPQPSAESLAQRAQNLAHLAGKTLEARLAAAEQDIARLREHGHRMANLVQALLAKAGKQLDD